MEGKIALVTGSTSGIGLGIAKELLKNGCEVILTGSRSKEDAAPAINEAKTSGSVVHYVQCDLSSGVDAICAAVDGLYPKGVDILVNNAGWGRIINISSVQGVVSEPKKGVYAATKHGLIGLTKGTALDVAAEGITVNAICPALLDTPINAEQFEKYAQDNNISVEETKKVFLAKCQPTRTMIDPLQIGQMAVYLCSWGGASVTGSVMMMDGGYTAQ